MSNDKVFLIDLDHTLYNVEKKELYPDAFCFIEFVKQKGIAVLFTEGVIGFQKNKIERLSLNKLFGENILIFDSYLKMSGLKDNFEGKTVYIIDDNPKVLEEARERKWITIRVIRGRYKNKKSVSDYTVSNLKLIESIIN